MPRARAVVTDLDNTLYSWVDYIVPSLEAMVASLVETTGRPRIDIVQSLKAVYGRRESNEYPFAIQESALFHPYRTDFDSFDALVVRPAQRAFAEARRRHLHPYPGVLEALAELRKGGVAVVALTDAPRNAVENRVRLLGLDGLLDALYALRGYALPANVNPGDPAPRRGGPLPAQDHPGGRAARARPRNPTRAACAVSCATCASRRTRCSTSATASRRTWPWRPRWV